MRPFSDQRSFGKQESHLLLMLQQVQFLVVPCGIRTATGVSIQQISVGSFQLRCWKKLSVGAVVQVCTFFWALSKTAQDALLWSIQSRDRIDGVGPERGSESEASSDDCQSRTTWFIDNVQVCRKAFARLLGIGQGRIQRTRHRFQGKDERSMRGQGLSSQLMSQY